jgi:hypothetical protein
LEREIIMQKIEDYIHTRKLKDKLDEFDFSKRSENMGKIINYVSEYFNDYLTPEEFSEEILKLQQNLEKSRKRLEEDYPTSHLFIEQFYMKHQKRIDTFIGKVVQNSVETPLCYRLSDYMAIAKEVLYNRLLMKDESEETLNNVAIAVEEYTKRWNEEPDRSSMKEVDPVIVKWIMDAYHEYGVNLLDFAYGYMSEWEKKYTETIYSRDIKESYLINHYDYQYQDNPFDINQWYEQHQDRPFIEGKKYFLEMLLMYIWLFEILDDPSYWGEYTQLMIKQRNLPLKNEKRRLIPVAISGISYPEEIENATEYIETKDGKVKQLKTKKYILAIINEKQTDNFWTNQVKRKDIIQNLKETFKIYGMPELLELRTPMKNAAMGIQELISIYYELLHELKTYKTVKIAIRTQSRKSAKEPLIYSLNDIMKLYNTIKEMKIDLKIMLDIVDTNGRNVLKNNMEDLVNTLHGRQNIIVGFYMNQLEDWGGYHHLYQSTSRRKVYHTIKNYQPFSEFMSALTVILDSTKPKYFIPQRVTSSEKLEALVDQLYRCGCRFE